MVGYKGKVHRRCYQLTRHQCSINCESNRLDQSASKLKSRRKTLVTLQMEIQKPSINETEVNIVNVNKPMVLEK